jgi:ATP-dependent HslUV protease ATP-binding subunit HslU
VSETNDKQRVLYLPGEMPPQEPEQLPALDDMTPREIVVELDKYIIGQTPAKRAVAVALRNRVRRQKLAPELAEEILPKNILMIGPTGVGKTEIARRLARLAGCPFVKVEASKYTEVGYVGRDVESMVRDLVENAIDMIREEKLDEVAERAEQTAEERLLDLLLPPPSYSSSSSTGAAGSASGSVPTSFTVGPAAAGPGGAHPSPPSAADEIHRMEQYARTREKLRAQFRDAKLDTRMVEVEVRERSTPAFEIVSSQGVEEMDINVRDMLSNFFGQAKKKRKMSVADAYEYLIQEEENKLIDMDQVTRMAVDRAEQMGIIFIDEVDKIAGRESGHGPDVSREGVQRDILPIVEGTTVNSRYGMIRTEHILFIAAGAFHVSKPSDLIPELQGRFPIRVELTPLTESDFVRILTEPKNALIKQYAALLETEGLKLSFGDDAIAALAKFAAQVNSQTENIGARRLHTILEKVLDEISFEAPEIKKKTIKIDAAYVQKQLADIVKDQDLSRYIL